MSSPRNNKTVVPIDECLYGPDRTCPPSVCQAVLSPVTEESAKDYNDKNADETTPMTTTSPPTSSPAAARSPGRSRNRSGLDDLEDGRWEAAMHSPENKSSSEDGHVISLSDLRRLASQGIVDGTAANAGSHRPVAWRVLLGYLPVETNQWKDVLLEHRQLYRSLVSELFRSDNGELYKGNELRGHHGKKRSAAAAARRQQRDENRKETANAQQESQNESSNGVHYLNGGTGASSTTDADEQLRSSSSIPAENNIQSRGVERSQSEPMADDDDDDDKEEDLQLPPSSSASTPPPRRRRSNSIGGSTPDDVGRLERRIDLTGRPPGDQSLSSSSTLLSKTTHHDDGYYETLVPASIREEWKRNGRDTAVLTGMNSRHGLNSLLVIDHHHHQQPKQQQQQQQQHDTTHSTPDKKKSAETEQQKHDADTDKWYQFFENASLLDEIRKDVVRTHPDLYFFLEPEHNLGQRRYAALERILFVWAKLNKGVRYVQGMNEIVGTLYYVLANDLNEEWACEAEADTYFLFNILMTEMRDVFVPALDDADTGIQGRIANMKALLSLHDPEVRCHLDDCGIDASFFAIRWLTTLLSREFLLPDTIRLWDSMFASTHKDNFLRYVCVTMVMLIRRDLLKGDFSTCLRLLQAYPPTNLDLLLESSRALWIYESQVTLACHKGGISLHQALSTITPPPSIVMAYGLPGGVALRRSYEDEGISTTTNRRLSATGRQFLQGAKGFIGGLSREVNNIRRSRSSGGDSTS